MANDLFIVSLYKPKKKLILWKLNTKKPVYEFTLSNAEMKKKNYILKNFFG